MMRPTKAEQEFEGDCYGVLHDPNAKDCLSCLVRIQCSIASLRLKDPSNLMGWVEIDGKGRVNIAINALKSFIGEFNRQDAISRVILGLRQSGVILGDFVALADKALRICLNKGLVRRVSHGKYERVPGTE